ncbi:MAG: addiction module protein [Burkholderiales bacterium]|jgi:putative addiction module component (TIGR02574 family)|nr:addiction module protein [Burkholderiales bacterium]
MSTLTPEIARLSLAERIQLVEDLWDSIAAEASHSLPLTEEQLAELQRRAQAHKEHPGAAIPWEQVRAELGGRVG